MTLGVAIIFFGGGIIIMIGVPITGKVSATGNHRAGYEISQTYQVFPAVVLKHFPGAILLIRFVMMTPFISEDYWKENC